MKGVESAWQVPCTRCGALVNFGDAQNALLDEEGRAHSFCPVCGEENTLFIPSPWTPEGSQRTQFLHHTWATLLLLLLILAMVLLLLPVWQPAPKQRKGYHPGLFAVAPAPYGLTERGKRGKGP